MSDFEGDNNLPSDMSDLEEAVTVLPPGHSRGAKTVTSMVKELQKSSHMSQQPPPQMREQRSALCVSQ